MFVVDSREIVVLLLGLKVKGEESERWLQLVMIRPTIFLSQSNVVILPVTINEQDSAVTARDKRYTMLEYANVLRGKMGNETAFKGTKENFRTVPCPFYALFLITVAERYILFLFSIFYFSFLFFFLLGYIFKATKEKRGRTTKRTIKKKERKYIFI